MVSAIINVYSLLAYLVLLLVMLRVVRPIYPIVTQLTIRYRIRRLAKNSLVLTPKQFFKLRNQLIGVKSTERNHHSTSYQFAGVYILHNQSKNMYYVGQAKHTLNRVNNHFTGKGNGDVYADYKYGDKWTIRMIALNESPFDTLNELERHTIHIYNAYTKGYNKNRGNQ